LLCTHGYDEQIWRGECGGIQELLNTRYAKSTTKNDKSMEASQITGNVTKENERKTLDFAGGMLLKSHGVGKNADDFASILYDHGTNLSPLCGFVRGSYL